MTTAQMTIKSVLNIIPNLPPTTSILLKGDYGIGKSQIGRQLAAKIRKDLNLSNSEFPIIDRRLSQLTEGDLLGLPSTDGDITKFNPPDWYKRACNEPCFLFLDELNRASNEVMQAAFQIVLDRELNGHKLHPQTRVMSAVNVGESYTVNEIDPALLDRFWCVELNATVDDWLKWARSAPTPGDVEHEGLQTNVNELITDFIANQEKWLDPTKNAEPTSVEPSRRSWDRLSIALTKSKLIDDVDSQDFYSMCSGFIGLEATVSFISFAKSVDSRITGKQVLNSFDKVKPKLDKLGPEKLNIIIEKLDEYIKKNNKPLTEKQGANFREFFTLLPNELKLSCWSKLVTINDEKFSTDKIELAKSLHKYVIDMVLEIFNIQQLNEDAKNLPEAASTHK